MGDIQTVIASFRKNYWDGTRTASSRKTRKGDTRMTSWIRKNDNLIPSCRKIRRSENWIPIENHRMSGNPIGSNCWRG